MCFLVVTVLVVVASLGGSYAQRGAGCRGANSQQGTCGTIGDCPPLFGLLGQLRAGTAPPGALDTLRRAICGYERNFPLVCCTAPGAAGVTPAPGDSSKLPKRCGISGLTDKIIDGVDAPLLAWPWMALLRGKVNGQLVWFCGGVLINDRYVLTAAHCFKSALVTLESVRLGEHTLQQNPDCEKRLCAPTPQDIAVERIISHPDYRKPCSECNDIALLRLAHPAILNPLHVVPICVPVNPQKDLGFSEAQYQGKTAWAAGWGSVSRDSATFVRLNTLQQVQLPIQNLDFCETLRKDYPDNRMVICAGGEGKDTCRGDSGGPLTLTNSDVSRHYVVGITSLGPRECGSSNTQGLYSSVSFYAQWILSNLQP